jgi:hypothetical protein
MLVSDWISVAGLILMGIVIPTVGYFIKSVSRFQQGLADVQTELALAKQRSDARDGLCEQHRQCLMTTTDSINKMDRNIVRLLERNKVVDDEHAGERREDGR